MRNRDAPKADGGGAAPPPRSLGWDILSGACLGAVLGGVLLGVGLLGALSAMLLGRHLAPVGPEDVRMAGYYVGSFALAGAGLGAAKPLLRTRIGTYVGFALAGAAIGVVLVMTTAQGQADRPSLVSNVIGGVGIGAILGCAFAHGLLHASG